MAASYPSSVKTYSAINSGDFVLDAHPEAAYDEITAIEQALLTVGFAHNLFPSTNNARDLGTSSLRWKDAYFAGTVTAATFTGAVPAGSIVGTGRSSAPTGWLLCDGSAVSRTTYADLFTAISTAFGVGDGSTTFNLPDLRGRAPIGAGTGSGLTARTLAATHGTETHTLSEAEMPSHTHTMPTLDNTVNGTAGVRSISGPNATVATNATGGGGAHNNMQPSLVVNFIIKT